MSGSAEGNHEKSVRIKITCDDRTVLEFCGVSDESLEDFRFSQWGLSPGMWCSVVLWTVTSILGECTGSALAVKEWDKQEQKSKHNSEINQASNHQAPRIAGCFLVACVAFSLTLNMETVCALKTFLNFYWTTPHHIPKDVNLWVSKWCIAQAVILTNYDSMHLCDNTIGTVLFWRKKL